MKRRKLKIIGFIFIVLFVVIAATSFIYVSDYYPSTHTLVEYQEDSEVNITEENSLIVIGDSENSSKGIIFYPGAKVENTAYIPLMEEIAKEGYVCFIVQMPGNLAVLGINKADKVIETYTDIDTWYIAGHSLGGAMASVYTEKNSENIEGIMLFGAYPSSDLSDINIRMLSIIGSEDKILNREKYESSKSNAPKEVEYIEIPGGNHGHFGDYGEQKGDGKGTITREEQIANSVKIILEWLNVT